MAQKSGHSNANSGAKNTRAATYPLQSMLLEYSKRINNMLDKKEKSFLKQTIPIAAFIAGLCCFTPVVLVLFGLSTVSFAASLSDTLYGTYKWVFRGAGLAFLAISLWWYFYKVERICTLDEARKNHNKIINIILITLVIGIIAYILWLYLIVHYLGVFLDIWA